MFKIIRKKKWDDLIKNVEFEIMELESKIEVIEMYNNEDSQSPDRRTDQAYLIHRERMNTQLPVYWNVLKQRRQFLKSLKEV